MAYNFLPLTPNGMECKFIEQDKIWRGCGKTNFDTIPDKTLTSLNFFRPDRPLENQLHGSSLMPHPHCVGEIWKRSFISTVRPTFHTKRTVLFGNENAPQTGEIWQLERRLCVLAWTENILKTKLFVNDDITAVMWFPYQSLPQTQLQNAWWLLRFQISPAWCWGKTFDASGKCLMSEWKNNS